VRIAVQPLDAQDQVDLLVGQRALAGRSRNDELTDQLDLVLQSVVGELSTGGRVRCPAMTLTERTIIGVDCLPFLEDLVTGTTHLGHGRTTRTSSFGLCLIMVLMASAPVDAPPSGEGSADGAAEDRGSFSHGVCRVCGWRGPGRRSRRVARHDAAAHLPLCVGEPAQPL
jgi:hypothetical protein